MLQVILKMTKHDIIKHNAVFIIINLYVLYITFRH